MQGSNRAFTLVELLVVIAIVGILTALGVGAGSRALAAADKVDSTARLRDLGRAIHLYASEHDQFLPGPLWPGQVMYYEPSRDGRMVRDLAPYLDIEQRSTAYVVDKMFPRAFRRNMPAGAPADARIYVMNSSVVLNGQTNAPFGSLTVSPILPTMRLGQLEHLPANERWMASEADQWHPDVVNAPWKANTIPRPVHDGSRAVLGFDGSVTLESGVAP